MHFERTHTAMLLKYGGISFIAGAVNHGFFSETRSLWTAAAGVIAYLLGAWLESRTLGNGKVRWREVLGMGIVLSIGLGFFTGGLQHFPDSPSRSLWVVPLGFVLSLAALYSLEGRTLVKTATLVRYSLISTSLVIAASALSWQVFKAMPGIGHSHEAATSDTHTHDSHASPAEHAPAITPTSTDREVVVLMGDNMRFTPSQWQATAGETVRIKVHNAGKLRHELVLGDEKALLEHAQMMNKNSGGHHHAHDNAVSVGPGETATLVWKFDKPGTVKMACFEPGHYDAGMKGDIIVTPAHAN